MIPVCFIDRHPFVHHCPLGLTPLILLDNWSFRYAEDDRYVQEGHREAIASHGIRGSTDLLAQARFSLKFWAFAKLTKCEMCLLTDFINHLRGKNSF
jgi:hypothetical protein